MKQILFPQSLSGILDWELFPYLISLVLVILGICVYSHFPNLSNTLLDQTGLSRILTFFVITNSLFSLIIPIALKRQALRNRINDLIFSLGALWASVFLILFEIVRGEPYYLLTFPDFANPFTRIAIIIWTIGIFYLLKTTFVTLSIDSIKFKKNGLEFKHNNPKNWGIKSLNDKLNDKLNDDKKFYFPIIVLGDESSRPRKVLLRFILSGMTIKSKEKLKKNTGAVYFTFTRPASEIKTMLDEEFIRMKCEKLINEDEKINWHNVLFIDCYTLKSERKLWNGDMDKSLLYYADSYNPHEINKKYESALRKLSDSNCGHVRVAYDAISDFLKFTDFQIATQYLRHNMGFEQRKKVESLYLFRMGTMEKTKEDYILWFANGLLRMQQKIDDKKRDILYVEFQGPFREPKKFQLDYKYNEI